MTILYYKLSKPLIYIAFYVGHLPLFNDLQNSRHDLQFISHIGLILLYIYVQS